MEAEVRIYAPTPILGYGYNATSLDVALAKKPHAIVVDAGSTDPGPNYLGGGESFTTRSLIKRDLRGMISATKEHGIPLLIGTAGGSGGTPHVAMTVEIVRELCAEDGHALRVAVIDSEQSKARLREHLQANEIQPLWPMGDLTDEAIERTVRVVGVMGAEPFSEAVRNGADVVIAGRSDDAAMSASVAELHGLPVAPGWLAGRFLECAGACAEPRHGFGYEGLFATVRADEVVLEPLHPGLRCTPISVAAFLLHENQSPVHHAEPSGVLDLTDLTVDPIDDRSVRLRGPKFHEAPEGSIKLEGVELAGYRTITPAWTRDPRLIAQIDEYLERATNRVESQVADAQIAKPGSYTLTFRLIGKDSVMGSREPTPEIRSHELGITADVVAPTQELARTIATTARQAIKNSQYEGKLCDEGCITFPYSPSEIDVGPVYRFSVWHTVSPADLLDHFPITYHEIGAERLVPAGSV